MKKVLLLVIIAVIAISVTTKANPVDVRIAKSVGAKFLNANTKIQLRGSSDLGLAATYSLTRGDAAFYVFNAPNGFVIVAGDDCAYPILGYSDNGRPFDPNNVPIQLQDVLQEYLDQIQYAIENNIVADENTAEQWRMVKATGKLSNNRDNTQVGPLLTTTWDQRQYYNAMCPENANGPDGHCVTGCVATAMAQIIKYHGYPQHGRGVHSYQSTYGELSVSFEDSEYDYLNMPNALTSNSSQEEVNAVAKLIYDCGVAVNMGYGANQSSAYIYNVVTALVNHFAFDPQLGLAQREPYTDAQWNHLLKVNIDSGKPIFYSSISTALGHSYVLDGYNTDDYYHINFGWNGSADGWYNLLSIIPNSDFSYNQSAILGIQPNSSARVFVGNTEWSKFVVEEALDLYNSYALNPYHFGHSDYLTENDTIVLVSENNEQLVIDFLRYYGGGIKIYDGQNTDVLLREIMGNTYPIYCNTSPVISSSYAFTIVFSGNHSQRDFHLRVAEESSCRTVSDIEATVDSTMVHLTWVENGSATRWLVEYGPEGFETGTTIETRTTDTVLNGFALDSIYEFRIRSVCDIGNFSPTNNIVINKKVYWTDVVTEKPEGYSMSPDGIITISSAEGLAWVSKITSRSLYDGSYNGSEYVYDGIQSYSYIQYIRHKLQLENDIELSGHIWKPMAWFGDVDGKGHVIMNMHAVCYEGWAKGGLFYQFGGDTIQDIGFVNAVTEGMHGGTIAGDSAGTPVVINCYSENCTIYSSSNMSTSGGLFGSSGATIINCYASGKMYGSRMGGLVGSGSPDMYNCYSSVKSFDYPMGYRGLLRASSEGGGSFINCYADIDYVEDTWSSNYIGTYYDENNTVLGYFLGTPQLLGDVRNLAGFTRQGGTMARIAPEVTVNYCYEDTLDLVTALNNGVIEKNSSGLRCWVWDSISGFPVFGDYYVVSCPIVSNVNAVNIPLDDGFAVALSWQENGDASEWQIKCLPSGIVDGDSAVYYSAFETNCIISGLALGKMYDIYVRPVCDDNEPIVWGDPIKFLVDKAYWVDVVTTRPDGYEEDADGNVVISSAEGLAWLSVCSNGLNGQVENNYSGKTVHLACDIDLGQYKWIPIGYHKYGGTLSKVFMGSFLGHGHTISNIYCYEEFSAAGCIGLFGQTLEAFISELNIENVLLDGYYNVGALCGEANNTTINDCHTSNVVVKGVFNVGGVIGIMGHYNDYDYQSVFYDNSASGVIYGDQRAGGLIGNAGDCYISNSYSNCDVIALALTGSESLGGLIGSSNAITENCYCVGSVEYSWYICGFSSGLLIGSFGPRAEIHNAYVQQSGSLSLFGTTCDLVPGDRISDTLLIIGNQLNTEIVINDIAYADLLSALNAWVDANNTEGQYLHWIADTLMVNGGFPIFEELELPVFEIAATAIPTEGGVVAGAGTYQQYQLCVLIASPNLGFGFLNWTENGEIVSNDAVYSFVVTGDRNLVANFENGLTVYDEGATNHYVPVYGLYADAYQKCEMVYPASDLNGIIGANINRLTYYISSPASISWTSTWQVFLKEVDNTSINAFTGISDAVVVYEGTLDGTGSEMTIDFTVPYHYNGGNLLVGIYNITKGGVWKRCSFFGRTVQGATVQGYSSSSLDAVNAEQRNFMPKTKFTFSTNDSATVTQNFNLTSGCNWVSFNIEINLDDLKAALVAASPNTAITIKSQTQKATYNPSNGRWTGRLTSLDMSQMYKITVGTACEITLEGVRINPTEHPVTITPGANWIAYPLNTSMTPQEIFTGFAVPGDMVKSQNQKKQYNSNGRWTGQLGSLEPGQGYIYTSSATEDRVFTFPMSTE